MPLEGHKDCQPEAWPGEPPRLSYLCGLRQNCTVAQDLPNPRASRMNRVRSLRLFLCCFLGGLAVAIAAILWTSGSSRARYVIDIFPGGDIQAALEAVARRPGKGTIRVHAGTYRPATAGQAFLFLNARHDGVTLEAVGDVVLSAGILRSLIPRLRAIRRWSTTSSISATASPGPPFRGFRVTGANGFVLGPSELMTVHTADDLGKVGGLSDAGPFADRVEQPLEEDPLLLCRRRGHADLRPILPDHRGGGVPGQRWIGLRRRRLGTAPGGALRDSVLFKDCIFRHNRAAVAGGGVDILVPGSWAVFENCLFVGNLSNDGIDANGGPGYAAPTVFPGSRATVNRCTFTGNRNAVDDRGTGSPTAKPSSGVTTGGVEPAIMRPMR